MSYLRITYFLRHVAFNKSVSAFFLPSEYNFIYVYSHYTRLHSAGCFEPFLLLSDAVNQNTKLQHNLQNIKQRKTSLKSEDLSLE